MFFTYVRQGSLVWIRISYIYIILEAKHSNKYQMLSKLITFQKTAKWIHIIHFYTTIKSFYRLSSQMCKRTGLKYSLETENRWYVQIYTHTFSKVQNVQCEEVKACMSVWWCTLKLTHAWGTQPRPHTPALTHALTHAYVQPCSF